MNMTEIVVVVLGLLLGYWLVSFFGRTSKGGQQIEQARVAADDALPWHQVLQIYADASPEEIHAAYQAERARYHPDQVSDLAPEFQQLAQRRLSDIEAAYRTALRQHGIGS